MVKNIQQLNFPFYSFRFQQKDNKTFIFDEIRKKFVVLQPEEWVRQHVIRFLIEEKKYPKSLINVEKELIINGLSKRYDVVVYRNTGEIFLMVECKAPAVAITQTTFDQIARYNLSLKSRNLMITNGLHHYYCQMNYEENKYVFMKELPDYQ